MIIVKPIITEKSLSQATNKKYTFQVTLGSSKTEIKNAIEQAFGVKVLKIQTQIVAGKTYRSGKRWIMRQKANWKKAVITLPKDKHIDLFEVPQTS